MAVRLLRICILLALASSALAQRGGFRGGFGGRHGGFSRGFAGGGFSGHRMHSGFGFNRGIGFSRHSFRQPRFGFGFGVGIGTGYLSYPRFYDYDYGYGYRYAYPPVAMIAPPIPYYEPAPVVISQNFAPPPAVREYRPPDSTVYREPIYLIAFNDHRIQAVVAYWVDGDTLHYVTRDHAQKQVKLNEIDRPFSEQLNRDRRVDFRLPRE